MQKKIANVTFRALFLLLKRSLPSAIFNLIQCLQLGQFNISVFFVVCDQSVSIKEQNIPALDKVLSLNSW